MADKKKYHPGGSIPTVGRRRRRRFPTRMPAGNPMMPTGGINRMGRPVRGMTAMPGPAPDAQRMRRMQQLMRRQGMQRRLAQQRMQQQQRRTSTPGMRTAAQSRPFNPNSRRQQDARRRMEQGIRGLTGNRRRRMPVVDRRRPTRRR